MAILKKNQLNQIMFVLVDKTDFASIESGATAASVAIKFYGVNHGSAAATSGAVSKAASVVHSGIFRQTLKAAECNYDFVTYRITHTSAADQVLAFQMATYDDTDNYSATLLTQSLASDAASAAIQANSRILLTQSLASDAASAAIQANSRVLLVQSMVSDTYSLLSDMSNIASVVWSTDITNAKMASNIASQVWGHAIGARVDSRVLLTQSLASDAVSAAEQVNSRVLLVQSLASDAVSAAQQANSRILVTQSLASDAYSAIILTQSLASDAVSAAQQVNSRALVNQSVMSDTYSLLTVASSRITLTQSLASDAHSMAALTKGFASDTYSLITAGVALSGSDMSDLRSAVAAGAAATITRSDISDIISGVWAYKTASQTGAGTASSRLQTGAYTASQVASMVWNETYTGYKSTSASKFGAVIEYRLGSLMSAVSDVYSNLQVTATSSDIASAVWGQKWDVHSSASTFGSALAKWIESGVNLRNSDMSDLRSAITAGPASLDNASVASAVWAHAVGARVDSRILLTQSLASDAVSAAREASSRALVTQSIASDTYSAVILTQSLASDAVSAAREASSRALVTQSLASDTYSAVIVTQSLTSDAWSMARLAASHASDAYSAILLTQSLASDAHSAALQANSRILLVQSLVSDIDSALTSQYSDIISLVGTTLGASDIYSKVGKILSRVTGAVATQSKLGAVENDVSDATSAARQVNSRVLLTQSYASDAYSAAAQANSRVLLTQSLASDAASAAIQANSRVLLVQSAASDILSNLLAGVLLGTSSLSDLRSAITAGPAAADTGSIASAVWAHAIASDVYSKIGKTSSRVTMMDTSILSDIRSAVAGVTATIDNASVASAVWAHATAAQVNSRVLLTQSLASDAASAAVQANSRILLTQSLASDAVSMVRQVNSRVTLTQSDASDALSAARQVNSRALVAQSFLSDIDSALTSQYSDVISKVLAGGLSSDAISDIAVAVWAEHYNTNSAASSFGSLFEKVASGVSDAYSDHILLKSTISDLRSMAESQLDALVATASDIRSAITAQDAAFADATTLTANTLKDRIRRLNWILQNKMTINDVSGDAVLYKDDNATAAFTVGAAVTDDGATTTRKRLE